MIFLRLFVVRGIQPLPCQPVGFGEGAFGCAGCYALSGWPDGGVGCEAPCDSSAMATLLAGGGGT